MKEAAEEADYHYSPAVTSISNVHSDACVKKVKH